MDFLEFHAQLPDHLLAFLVVQLRGISGELLARAADGETLFVEQAADLADHHDVMALVITAIAATLDGLELWKFLFPLTQNMRLDGAKFAHFANGEVALAGNRRQFDMGVTRVQHNPLPLP